MSQRMLGRARQPRMTRRGKIVKGLRRLAWRRGVATWRIMVRVSRWFSLRPRLVNIGKVVVVIALLFILYKFFGAAILSKISSWLSNNLDSAGRAALIGVIGAIVVALIPYIFRSKDSDTVSTINASTDNIKKELRESETRVQANFHTILQRLSEQQKVLKQFLQKTEINTFIYAYEVRIKQDLEQIFSVDAFVERRITFSSLLPSKEENTTPSIPLELIHLDQRTLEATRGTDESQEAKYLLSLPMSGRQRASLDDFFKKPGPPEPEHRSLIGHPGLGGTTILKYLAWQALMSLQPEREAAILPFYIEGHKFVAFLEQEQQKTLKNLDDTGKVIEILVAFLAEQILQISQHFQDEQNETLRKELIDSLTFKLLKDRNVILLIDTLVSKYYDNIMRALKDLLNIKNKNIQIVVTLSPTQQEIHKDFIIKPMGTILAFSPGDIEALARKRFGSVQKLEDCRRFIRILQRNPRIQILASNPRLLEYLVNEYLDKNNTVLFDPQNHADLYRSCANRLLLVQGEQRVFDPQDPFTLSNDQERLLSSIAWYLHDKHKHTFKHLYGQTSQLDEMFPPCDKGETEEARLAKWYACLDDLIENNSLLVPVTAFGMTVPLDYSYKFLSIPLQEYFAACYYVQRTLDERENMLWKPEAFLQDPWWEEVILLCINMEHKKGQSLVFQRCVVPAPVSQEEDLETLLFEARAIQVHPNGIGPGIFSSIKNALLIHMMSTECFFIQKQVVGALYEMHVTSIIQEELDVFSKREKDLKNSFNVKARLEAAHYQGVPTVLLPLFTHADIAQDVCQLFVSLYRDDSIAGKKRKIEDLWRIWDRDLTTMGSMQRMYIASGIALLEPISQEPGQALFEGLLGRLEKEQDVSVSWIMAYALGEFGSDSGEIVKSLNFRRTSVSICWHMLGLLYKFALLGQYSGTEKLHEELRQIKQAYSSDCPDPDIHMMSLYIYMLLKLLKAETKQYESFIEDTIRSNVSDKEIVARALRDLRYEYDSDNEQRLLNVFDLIRDNAVDLADRLRLLDVVIKLANTANVLPKLHELLTEISLMKSDLAQRAFSTSTHYLLYESNVYATLHQIRRRVNGR